MRPVFLDVLHSEWLKQRRSLASWMVIAGACFTPLVILTARLMHPGALPRLYASADFWTALWRSAWESAALFFLPMGTVLATSLLAQIEFRNNTWKQVHALPLTISMIYYGKLTVVLLMLALFLALFNLGIWLSAVIPCVLVPGVAYPTAELPWADFLRDTSRYFLDCLPIVALQYLLSLRYRNFLVPVGVGFMLWVATLGALPWRWGSLSPHAYPILEYLHTQAIRKAPPPVVDIHVLALAYFVLFTLLGHWLFATQRMKG